MKQTDKLGVAAALMSVGIALAVLMHTDNGRMAQEGFLLQILATMLFVVAGLRGSRWWLCAPVLIVLFWIGVAHIQALWK